MRQSARYDPNAQREPATEVSRGSKKQRPVTNLVAVARHLRRLRKTPRRARRPNHRAGKKRLPPSTRARWGLKVRIAQWLARYYPLTTIVIEDIKAPTRPDQRLGVWRTGEDRSGA